ncbi:MAG TPA: DUF2318 domain-containing protein [Anaerovoracaceae bacterium]|nr:DUF2318 domain-containing protein [Anaerovoracaceae bacterium]
MNKKSVIIAVVAVIAVVIASYSVFFNNGNGNNTASSAKSVTNENGDMEIPISGITDKASFYSYDELDSKMEVIAVKASDGTIRTAFNTCQVCYSSGKGYYVQEGDYLVCQNCGNKFGMDDVEVTKGGCNPVPIYDEQTKTNSDTIVIPNEFLKEAEVIFKNWKV